MSKPDAGEAKTINRELFKEITAANEIQISSQQLDQFELFFRELKEWNKSFNLTAIENDDEIVEKHFYDSLLAAKIDIWTIDSKLVDIGTGAGFPGIPLKILKQNIELLLVDSLQKRVSFLNHITGLLKLNNTQTVHARAEEIGRDARFRENQDIVVSRAVAKLPVLLEYCLPLLKIGGHFIAYKGPDGLDEIDIAHKALKELGGEFIEHKNFILPRENSHRTLIVFKKTQSSTDKYPRRPGLPLKKPLI